MPKKTQQSPAADAHAILDRLERVVRWADDFRLAFVRCNHPVQREEMRRQFLDRLSDRHVLEVFLEKPILSLLDELTARWDAAQPPHAVCVYGLEKSIQEQREASPVLGRLNHDRDLLRRAVSAALLIWLPDFALDCLVRGAPDFWAWRSGVYEFPTDMALWQTESDAALDSDIPALFSLPLEDKRKEIARLEELLQIARALPHQGKREQETLARLLHQLGLLHYSLGEWNTAQARCEESLQIAQRSGDQQAIAVALHQLGMLAQDQGDYTAARSFYEQSLAMAQELGYRAGMASNLHNLGVLAQDWRDYAAARSFYEQSLAIKQELGDRIGIASSLHQLGRLAQDQGDSKLAQAYYERSLYLRPMGDQRGFAFTIWSMGNLQQRLGDLLQATYMWWQALDIFERLGAPQAEALRALLAKAERTGQA
jgi:tetratricopeptide (TPR) repeat protein